MRKLKEQVIRGGLELCDEGLIARTWGNVSIRTGDKHFAITASGKDYHDLTVDEIVDLNIDNLSYISDIKPSGEKKVHQVIYKLKPDAGFVIHTHQSNASAVAAMGLAEVELPKEYPGIGSVLPCAPYGLPGTKAVSNGVAKCVRGYDSKAILMSNHGAVCYGKDYDEAFQIVKTLEEACGDFLESIGVEPQRSASGSYDVKWQEPKISAYLDDFAQMFGPELDVTDYNPVRIAIENGEDEEAVRMVIEKNCRAGHAAMVVKAKPIKRAECILMRAVYKKKYSKLKDEK